MGKSHRDNHRARVKRGQDAFDKKAKRRKPVSKCSMCGNKCREAKLLGSICDRCSIKIGG